MAEIAESLTVDVTPRITVDFETARVCLKLVDWFLEANEEYRLCIGGRADHGLTTDDEQVGRWRDYFRGRYDGAQDDEERAKWRRLAGLEDE